MTSLTRHLNPQDPSTLGYPPTLPIEIALKTATVPEICEAYNLTREDWERLRQDPVFLSEVKQAVDALKKEGVSFKMKARLQAEELLGTAWKLIHSPHDDVAPAVKADLLKFIIRCAGLSEEKSQGAVNNGTALQINIDLGGR